MGDFMTWLGTAKVHRPRAEGMRWPGQSPRSTVLTVEQVDTAIEAGAAFVVTPGYSRDVVAACQACGIPVIPGVATPTEIQMALQDGITLVKFFPAEAIGGTRALSAIAAPFPMLRFIPTGGISPENLQDYLALPSVVAVGGSWMVPASLVSAQKWADVSRLAAEAVATVARHRPAARPMPDTR